MVNWLPVPSNNHPVTRATTLIQWQKLFQAPEPKLSSQTAPPPPPPPPQKIFFFFFSSGFFCRPYSLLLLTTKI